MTKNKNPEHDFADKSVAPKQKLQKDDREKRLFDGSGATIKDRRRPGCEDLPPTEATVDVPNFEEGTKAKMAVFNSTDSRFDKTRATSLGPAAYVNNTDVQYQMKGVTQSVFGSAQVRNDLL